MPGILNIHDSNCFLLLDIHAFTSLEDEEDDEDDEDDEGEV